MFILFKYSCEHVHRHGGMLDAVAVFEYYDEAVAAMNAEPEPMTLDYYDILDCRTQDYHHYRREYGDKQADLKGTYSVPHAKSAAPPY